MSKDGEDVSEYTRENLMNEEYDSTDLAIRADEKIKTFQADAAREAGIFHHLIEEEREIIIEKSGTSSIHPYTSY